jgi:hypothetical protein
MSRGQKNERNNRNFANLVLNHMDNNNNRNSGVDVNSMNLEFASEHDAQSINNDDANLNVKK